VVHDRSPEARAALERDGAIAAASLEDFITRLGTPRAIWLMVPAAVVNDVIASLRPLVSRGDIIIDGGNSHYQDAIARSKELASDGIHYLDVGTSGGVWGLERGYCLMVGGDTGAVKRIEPLLQALAPGRGSIPVTKGRESRTSTAGEGYLHCGPSGAGHFVKMIHNGIEYGLMQSYAEGFDILRHASHEGLPDEQRYDLDLAAIAEVWRRGSVISSWLLDLAAIALAKDPGLDQFTGHVEASGEGRWTVATAMEEEVSATVLTAALYARFRSRTAHTFADKVLSALRAQFGGHVEPPR
jgi:6-phosphogluconate dehydrogenase